MYKDSFHFLGFIFLALLLFSSRLDEKPYQITQKNVDFKNPKNFPKPVYTFEDNKPTPAGFTLGRNLFYDPILSRDSSTSCASCHQPFAAFAHIDHKLSHGINNRIGNRNVPAIQNLIWNDRFMWDGRVDHLETQALNPITNKDEMDENMEHILVKLRRNPAYRKQFLAAFNDSTISSEKVLKSLTQFTGLMISSNSKYDLYKARKAKFSAAEKRGLKLFQQKCNACHSAPLFTNRQFVSNGLKVDSLLNDLGRGKITGKKSDDYAFKVPSLRNVEVTYPYMHDGSKRNLTQVLKHYANLSSEEKKSNPLLMKIGTINDQEAADLIQFLKTLTDRTFLYDRKFLPEN